MAAHTVVSTVNNPDGTQTVMYSDGASATYAYDQQGRATVVATTAAGGSTRQVQDSAGKTITIQISPDGSVNTNDPTTKNWSAWHDSQLPNNGLAPGNKVTAAIWDGAKTVLPFAAAGAGAVIGGPAGAAAGYGLGKAAQSAANTIKTQQDGTAVATDTNGNTTSGGAYNGPGAQQALIAPPPTPTYSQNTPGTASRAGTSVQAPADVQAPTNNFRGSLVAGTVAQQAPITTQQVYAPQAVAGQAAQTAAVQGTTFAAPQNTFKAGVTAGNVGVQGPINAQQVTAPQNDFKGSLVAGQLGAPDKITAQQIGSSITPDQQQAIDLSRAQALGTAPSAAQALLQKGIDQNVGTAYGLAASLSGRNAGQALLQGGSNAASAIAKSSADMAALRAQEIATGTERFGALSTTAAGQDLTRNTANQSANLTQQVDNISNTINVLTGNRDAALKAGQQNQADNLTALIENQKEKLSALQGNQSANLTAQIETVKNTINVLTGNRDAALKAGLQNQADSLTAQIENQKSALSTLQSNQSTLLAAAQSTATNTTNVNINNAQFQTQASQTNATVGEAASAANALNALNAQIQTAQNNINVLQGNRDAALRAGDANQQVNAQAALDNAKNQLSALQGNQSAALAAAQSSAANATTLSAADLTAFSSAMQLNSQQQQQLNQLGVQAWIAQQDDATKNRAITVAANTAHDAASSAFYGQIISGIATTGAALGSAYLNNQPKAA